MTDRDPASAIVPYWIADLGLRWGFRWGDRMRRLQGAWLDAVGHGPVTTPAREVARRPGLRVLAYGAEGAGAPPLLIVPAPIKRHYIWDLEPATSVVAHLVAEGFAVHLAQWVDEAGAAGGLEAYADELLGAACDAIAERHQGTLVLLGHSLGGTLAAIFAAARPERVSGLVLVEAPLRFAGDASVFSSMLARDPEAPERLAAAAEPIPGSVLDAASITAAPGTFVGEPLQDLVATEGDPALRATHMRARRWAFDEFQMPARLFADVVGGLYRDDLFARGLLEIGGRRVRAADIACPVLAVVDPASELMPRSAIRPVLAEVQGPARIVEHGGEVGVLFQHVGALVGRRAHQSLWPEIVRWIRSETASHPGASRAARPKGRASAAAASSRRRRSSR
jgi:polyhydroxyalkanoate synthase